MGGVVSKKKARRIKKEEVQLPEDVTVEILKKLPVKSLLRFSCACKTWYSAISDPGFRNKWHQRRSCMLVCKGYRTFSTVAIESLLMSDRTSILPTPLDFPWEPEPDCRFYSKLLGSCDGLVCVDHKMSFHGGSYRLIIWNPSTRKYRDLPCAPRVRNWWNHRCCVYPGFGYDESKDDYKFVWLAFRELSKIEFDVFSLKSNTWTSSEYRPSPGAILWGLNAIGEQLNGVFLNGAIHWVTYRQDDRSSSSDGVSIRILALDLKSEEFRMLESPQEFDLDDDYYVVSLSGFLCLCIHYRKHYRKHYRNPDMIQDSCVHLWMMKEYGVDSSWLKLVSFPTTFFTFYPTHFSDEEGKIVAVVEHPDVRRFGWSCDKFEASCEVMRLQVEEGAVVSTETLLCDDVSSGDLFQVREDNKYSVLHMEESLVSLN